MKIEPRGFIIAVVVACVYAWCCYAMGEHRAKEKKNGQPGDSRTLFGRRWYSRRPDFGLRHRKLSWKTKRIPRWLKKWNELRDQDDGRERRVEQS